MKYLLIAAAFLSLSACAPDSTLTVDGGVDVKVLTVKAYAKLVNGILYIKTDDEVNHYCLSIDPSSTYNSVWLELPEFDKLRLSVPSNEENIECAHQPAIAF